MKRYRHLFFDLDHTLWDFRSNSRLVLKELYDELDLAAHGVSDADAFVEVYEEVNTGLWKRYERGHRPKDVMRVLRFRNTLLTFGVKERGLSERLGHEYLERTPRREGLFPGALQLLEDLRPHYGLHIITNGFAATQHTKIRNSRMDHLFDIVLSSEVAGASKPAPDIFHKAFAQAGTTAEESLMIGDSIDADMAGARAVGMDHAHFAPEGEADPDATYRIRALDELRPLLLG
ncbi:MAG: YjjG family noncanonical pyrimidine nucleotidase [Flavobacteriales bacterium]